MSSLMFTAYSMLSIGAVFFMVGQAISTQNTFYDIVICLTNSKLKLVLFLNCLIALLSNAVHLLVYVFFGQIRTVESKFLIDKSYKKVFQFLLLTAVLRNSLDIYKVMSLSFILFVWIVHWLLSKRTKGLIGEENRNKSLHARLICLFVILIFFDALITYIFAQQFYKHGNKMSDIYIIGGFEFARLLLKSIEDNFKYQVSLFELHYREQWLEKKFVFNCVSILFDSCDLLLNLKVFFFIISGGFLPIYLLGEIVDNLTRLGTSCHALYKWRQFIEKLRRLKDVEGVEEGQEGEQIQCCICLGDIKKGKQLSCSHVFHLVCLRSWLIEKVECPTCRKPIELDKQVANQEARRANQLRAVDRRQNDENRDGRNNNGDALADRVNRQNRVLFGDPVDPDAVPVLRADLVNEPAEKKEKGTVKGIFDAPKKSDQQDPGLRELKKIRENLVINKIREDNRLRNKAAAKKIRSDELQKKLEDKINLNDVKPAKEETVNALKALRKPTKDVVQVLDDGEMTPQESNTEPAFKLSEPAINLDDEDVQLPSESRFIPKSTSSVIVKLEKEAQESASQLLLDDKPLGQKKKESDKCEVKDYDLLVSEDLEDLVDERTSKVSDQLKKLQAKHDAISAKVQSVLNETMEQHAEVEKEATVSQRLMADFNKEQKRFLKAKEAAKARMAAKTKKSKEVNLPASAADCYAQNLGSVPFGLPCLAVTRRTQQTHKNLREIERVNHKLCKIFRVPSEYIEVDGDENDEKSEDSQLSDIDVSFSDNSE